jgi:hypothetical protein
MYQISIKNLDNEVLNLEVTESQLKQCVLAIEEGKTFHIDESKQGFFFPLKNIRFMSYQFKPEPQGEVCLESQSQSQ